jgi:hypothetical protein
LVDWRCQSDSQQQVHTVIVKAKFVPQSLLIEIWIEKSRILLFKSLRYLKRTTPAPGRVSTPESVICGKFVHTLWTLFGLAPSSKIPWVGHLGAPMLPSSS